MIRTSVKHLANFIQDFINTDMWFDTETELSTTDVGIFDRCAGFGVPFEARLRVNA